MKQALVVVDMQNDFLPGGPLAVPGGDIILPFVANLVRMGRQYELLVFTKDWHPDGHGSFASAHPGASLFEVIELSGQPQVLWPDHCVQNTSGACLADEIEKVLSEAIAAGRKTLLIEKGQRRQVDSYSAFYDNARLYETKLKDALHASEITELDVVGLALDYCVKATALDAVSLGFKTRVLLQGTRAVDSALGDQIVAELAAAGVTIS